MRVFTNLNLHHDVPVRIQPEVGEWGSVDVVATRRKRRARWLWILAIVAVTVLLFVFGHWTYGIIMNVGS